MFTDACVLEVIVETTGFCGGDTGHGGRTTVSLVDHSSTDMERSFVEEGRVEIRMGGDAELRSLIRGLRFAADSLAVLSGYIDGGLEE